jgi:5-methylcytosine-specific restriction endonuclease McrA
MTRAKRKREQQKVRQFKHQNGLCCWCLEPMELKMMTPEEWKRRSDYPKFATWEHLIPKAQGGTDSRHNRVLAHRVCNNARGTKARESHFAPYSAQT